MHATIIERTSKSYRKAELFKGAIKDASLALLVLIHVAFLWLILFKPFLEKTIYRISQSYQAMESFRSARSANELNNSIENLEKLTHEGSGVAYVLLQSIYRVEDLKRSGIDLRESNADLESVDFTQSDDLLRRAFLTADDIELQFILRSNSSLFSEMDIEEKDMNGNPLKASTINSMKISSMSTLTQEEKDELKACLAKLNEKFPSGFWMILNYHSVGTCRGNPRPSAFEFIRNSLANSWAKTF